MDVSRIGKRIVNCAQKEIKESGAAISKNSAKLDEVAQKVAVDSGNEYVAVKMPSGLIGYIPAKDVKNYEGAEIICSNLNTVEKMLEAMQAYCNIIKL